MSGYIHLRIILQYAISRFLAKNLALIYSLLQVNRQLNELAMDYLSTIPDFYGCRRKHLKEYLCYNRAPRVNSDFAVILSREIKAKIVSNYSELVHICDSSPYWLNIRVIDMLLYEEQSIISDIFAEEIKMLKFLNVAFGDSFVMDYMNYLARIVGHNSPWLTNHTAIAKALLTNGCNLFDMMLFGMVQNL